MRYLRYTRHDDAGRVRVCEFLHDMEGEHTMEDVQMVVQESVNAAREFRVEMVLQGVNPEDAILTCIDKCKERPHLAEEHSPRSLFAHRLSTRPLHQAKKYQKTTSSRITRQANW